MYMSVFSQLVYTIDFVIYTRSAVSVSLVSLVKIWREIKKIAKYGME